MECTKYAAGMYLGEKDVSSVVDKLRKEYPHVAKSELDAIARDAIVEHNQSTNILTRLGGRLLYEDAGKSKVSAINSIDLIKDGMTKYKVQVELSNGDNLTFVEDKDGDLHTGDIYSNTLTQALHSTPRKGNSLFNTESSKKTMDEVFNGLKVDTDTVNNIMSKMIEIDKKSTNDDWDAQHSKHLQSVLEGFTEAGVNVGKMVVRVSKNIVDTLNEPLGEFNPNKPKGSQIRIATADIREQAQNRLIMSNQETLVHEVEHAALDFALDNNLDVVGQDIKTDIHKIYRQAKKVLTYKDIAPEDATDAELATAKELYNYVFNGKLGDNSILDANTRLKEFINYGTTNKYFKKAIDELPLATKKMKYGQYDSWVEKTVKTIINAVQGFISTLSHKKNRANTIGQELTRLVFRLAKTQQKYAYKAKSNSHIPIDEKVSKTIEEGMNKIDKAVKSVVDTGLDKVGLGKDSKYTKKELEAKVDALSKMLTDYKKAGSLRRTVLLPNIIAQLSIVIKESEKGNLDEHYGIIVSKMMNHMDNTAFSFIKDLIADFSSGRKTLEEITDMAMEFNSHLDRYKEANYLGTLNDVYNGFTKINLNNRKNRKYVIALNKVILRGDIQALTTDATELTKILTDNKYVATKIGKLEASLKSLTYEDLLGTVNVGKDMITKAKELANYTVNGTGLRTNAENIARNFGTVSAVGYDINTIPEYSLSEVTQQVDELASLYALDHINSQHKAEMLELINKDSDGVTTYLENARGAQVAAKEDWLLSGNMQDMVKGQLHEKTDKYKDIQYAPLKDARKMGALGYRLVRKVNTDSADPIKEEYGLYASDETGLTNRVDGTLGLQRIKIKGLLLSEKTRLRYEGLSPSALAKKVRETIVEAANSKQIEDMTPVYNDQGQIIDFRYDYSIKDKEQYLNMEQKGTELLARSFGQRHTQNITDVDNRELLDTIYKDYAKLNLSGKLDKDTSHLYVKVEAVQRGNLTKKEQAIGKIFADDNVYVARTQGEELWGLLPPDARKYIIEKNREIALEKLAEKLKKPVNKLTAEDKKDIKDEKTIYIRKDLIKQVFGYDELSVADSKLLKQLPDSYKRKIRLAGRLWSDLMQVFKASVVVKLPHTVIGNILSNAKFLWYGGMPAKKSLELLLLSKKSLIKWKEDETRIRQLERQIDSNSGVKRRNLEKELAEVKAERDDNPLKPLMDMGVYQTIVDDVSLDDSNNKIVNLAENTLGKFIGDNKTVEEIVHTLVMSRKSTLGKLALNLTAESDLHFRAATYWFGKEKIDNNNKLSSKEKKSKMKELERDVKDNFINYSKVINSRFIQWLDKMGPEAFWKYFAFIQKVVLKLVKKRTTKVIADLSAEHYLGLSSGVLDSSILFNWGTRLNPLAWISNTTNLISGGTDIPLFDLFQNW